MAAASGQTIWKKAELEDNTVEYFLFPKFAPVNKKSEAIELLKEVKDSCMSLLQSFMELYIWQNESFALHVPPESSFTLAKSATDSNSHEDWVPPYLYGRTCFGDCPGDEWFIVFLLMWLTREVPGLVVRLADADGEFLLIEAADHVPDGYDPDTAEGRVYLFEGEVHLLPLSLPDDQLTSDNTPVTMAAVDAVRDGGSATRANDQLQRDVQQKIEGYPGKITESHHRAVVSTPVAAAALLEACPQLLPAAVQAFYLRDPLDARACRSMRFFPPETCVRTAVTFTKTLYAQLVHQPYRPDPRTGWQLPPGGDPAHRAADVGMKLACGLEILACRSRPPPDEDEAEPSLDELRDDVRWQRYLASLRQKRFFGEELEGSKKHSELLEKARQYYISHMMTESRHSPPGEVIHKLLANVKLDRAQWKRREAELPPADDDSWLEVSSEQLDQLLRTQFQLQQQPPEQLSAELADFLGRLSGLDGVEPDSAAPSRKSSQAGRARKTSRKLSAAVARKISTLSQASTSSAMSSLSQKIDFNAEAFSDALRGMLDLDVDGDWSDSDDSSGMSSYGDEPGSAALDELLDEPGSLGRLGAKMDEELRDSTLAESFVRATKAVRKESGASDCSAPEEADFRPVDVDLNAVQNLLQALQGDAGAAGPAQTMLQNMQRK